MAICREMQSSNVLSRSTHSQLDLLPLWQQSMPATWSAFQPPLGQSGGEGLSYHWSHWTIWEWKEIKIIRWICLVCLTQCGNLWESSIEYHIIHKNTVPGCQVIQVIHWIIQVQSGAQARRLPTRDHQSREHTLLPERCSSAEAVGGFFADRSWCFLWDSNRLVAARYHSSLTISDQISLFKNTTRFHCNSPCSRCCKMLQDVARCCKRQISKNHGWIEIEVDWDFLMWGGDLDTVSGWLCHLCRPRRFVVWDNWRWALRHVFFRVVSLLGQIITSMYKQ